MSKLELLKEIVLREVMPDWFNTCTTKEKENLLQNPTGFAEMLGWLFHATADTKHRKENLLYRSLRMESSYNDNPTIEQLGYRGYIERTENPYPENTSEYTEWDRGYKQADEDNPPFRKDE